MAVEDPPVESLEREKADARAAIAAAERRIASARVELTAAINESAAAHNVLNDIIYREMTRRREDER